MVFYTKHCSVKYLHNFKKATEHTFNWFLQIISNCVLLHCVPDHWPVNISIEETTNSFPRLSYAMTVKFMTTRWWSSAVGYQELSFENNIAMITLSMHIVRFHFKLCGLKNLFLRWNRILKKRGLIVSKHETIESEY